MAAKLLILLEFGIIDSKYPEIPVIILVCQFVKDYVSWRTIKNSGFLANRDSNSKLANLITVVAMP